MPDDAKLSTSAFAPLARGRLRRRGLLALAVILAALAVPVSLVWVRSSRLLPPPPPASDDPDVARAIADARTEVMKAPGSAAAWGELGMVLLANEFNLEAAPCFAQAEVLDRQNARWPVLRGMALRQTEPEEAAACLARAVALRPQEFVFRLRLAELLQEQGQNDEAEKQFREVLAQDDENHEAHLGLGRLAVRRGNLRDSIVHLQQAAGDAALARPAHLLLAEVFHRLHNATAAARELALAQRLRPSPVPSNPFAAEVNQYAAGKKALLVRVDQLLSQNRLDEAVAAAQVAAKRYPALLKTQLTLAKVLLNRATLESDAASRFRDCLAAARALERAERLGPTNNLVQFYLGALGYVQKDRQPGALAAAARHFHKALELRPESAVASYNLARCLRELGDAEGAERAYRQAVHLGPDFAQAHAALGNLLAARGELVEALRHLGQAVELDPQDRVSLGKTLRIVLFLLRP
jgi:tetratricopeptide (TPR) repeat protein